MNRDETLALLAGGPKVKRTHCYRQGPNRYEIQCPKDGGHKITWSEYERRIWCYECHEDYIPEHAGIFDGPICVELSHLLGISFDRLNVKTGRVVPFSAANDVFNATWVQNESLREYEKVVKEKLEADRRTKPKEKP